MKRRELITLLGGAVAAWPLAARAQQRPAVPVIGFLSGRTADSDASALVSLRRSLGDLGYVEGRNVAIEYRFADGEYDRLPALFTDLLARRVALIVYVGDARDATATLGQKLLVLEASTGDEFAGLDREPANAMFVTTSPFFVTRAGQIAALAARHRIPAIYARREYVEAGGLMSYGFNVADLYRELGRYAGHILNGEKPADLPIIQATKYELVINPKAAKAISFEFPPLIRALADEVIE
jgi:putative ABC transport system substrate-binding protein